jgi:hypothetical protein
MPKRTLASLGAWATKRTRSELTRSDSRRKRVRIRGRLRKLRKTTARSLT